MRIKRSTFKNILRRKLYEILDAEEAADVEAKEGVWAGCEDAGNLELDIDFAKAAGSEPVTDEQEVMLIVQQEVRKYLRETAIRKNIKKRRRVNESHLGLRHVAVMSQPNGAPVPIKSRASAALQAALRGEGIPNALLEALQSHIEKDVRSGLSESAALENLRDEVDDFIHLWQLTKK